jgi:hypothetical protein
VTGVFYLLVICAEVFGVGRPGIPGFAQQPNPLGYLTSQYWSPSALWVIDLVVVLTGLGSSWPRSTRLSGSFSRWDVNGSFPSGWPGCPAVIPRLCRLDALPC